MGFYVQAIDDDGSIKKVLLPDYYTPPPRGNGMPHIRDLYPRPTTHVSQQQGKPPQQAVSHQGTTQYRQLMPCQQAVSYQAMPQHQASSASMSEKIQQAQREWQNSRNSSNSKFAPSRTFQVQQNPGTGQERRGPKTQDERNHHGQSSTGQRVNSSDGQLPTTTTHHHQGTYAVPSGRNTQQGQMTSVAATQPAIKPRALSALGKRSFSESSASPSQAQPNHAGRVLPQYAAAEGTAKTSSPEDRRAQSPNSADQHVTANALLARLREEMAHKKRKVGPTQTTSQNDTVAETKKARAETPAEASHPRDDGPRCPTPEAPKTPEPFTQSLDSPPRDYDIVPHEDGRMLRLPGFVAPTGYSAPKYGETVYPCPVIDCHDDRNFVRAEGVARHMQQHHASAKFNDNLDGTLTDLGRFNKARKSKMPIVVSRTKRPSPVVPSEKIGYLNSSHASEPAEPREGSVKPRSVREILRAILSPSQIISDRRDIFEMASLPVQRLLPKKWVDAHAGTIVDQTHIACAVAYMVGPKSRCFADVHPSSRLSDYFTCVLPPPGLTMEALRRFNGSDMGTCVGCKYWSHIQRRKNRCTLLTKNPPIPIADSSRPKTPDSEINLLMFPADDDQKSISPTGPAMDIPEEPSARRPKSAAPPGVPESWEILPSSVKRPSAPTAEFSQESWEVAPGRFATTEAPDIDIAFSTSYTAGQKPVVVRPDWTIHHFVLSAAGHMDLQTSSSQISTYMVTKGKVKVVMGATELRVTAPAGAFVLDPGKSCKITNEREHEAMVVCTTIDGYDE